MQPRLLAQFAPVEAFVELLQQTHVAERIQSDAAGQHQPVAAVRADEMVDDVHQRIFEHHLRRRRLVEPLLRILAVLDVFDAQHRVRVPHVLEPDRLAQDADQLSGVRMMQNVARPIGEIAVDVDAALGLQTEDRFERGVVRIGLAVAVAVGGGAHVAAFAREPGPAALRRRDHRVEDAERVEHAVIAIELAHAAALAQIKRDRPHVAEPVEHRHHHRLRVVLFLGKGRSGERVPGVIVVVRRADQRHRRAQAELAADVARRPRAAVEIAQIEQRRGLA